MQSGNLINHFARGLALKLRLRDTQWGMVNSSNLITAKWLHRTILQLQNTKHEKRDTQCDIHS